MFSVTVHMFKTLLVDIVVGRSLNWQWDGAFDKFAEGLTLDEIRKVNEFLKTPDADDDDMQCGFCELYAK